MTRRMTPDDLARLAPAGHYMALRIGFAFPMEEVNALPQAWIEHYTRSRLLLHDPVMRWGYAHTGIIDWTDLRHQDPQGVLAMASAFGLRFGVAVSVFDDNADGQRSLANFSRGDRDFTGLEKRLLLTYVTRRHTEMAPPRNLTAAELQALCMVKDGMRLKQIAYDLGVTEGAVKQRLKNAKVKLHANTSTQAAAMARQFRLI
ncbi:transcriptional regulator, LuxR family [Loktanella fryxellensis]|uniref:Transcriptional regulator, LuxR family n=2 Tax=Loktanella fryxellensis TaxID=245187 RepID=A0A1H7YFE2_9RHOB|nr:transcriptional regulator, LuxR family [Loktanella fryxellensis]